MSPQEYEHQLERLGLKEIKIQASNIPEAKEALQQVREAQRQLRQIKQAVNLDMKDIRANYRNERGGAASTSSALVTAFGKRKLAGQMRADAKRQLSREEEQVLKPYEQLKLIIDNQLIQLDTAKGKLDAFINGIKVEEQTAKQSVEDTLKSLRMVHLATPHPNKPLVLAPRKFNVSPPMAPPQTFTYTQIKPSPPTLQQPGMKGMLSKAHRQKVEADNQRAIANYERKLTEWEAEKERQEAQFRGQQEAYQIQLKKWGEAKAAFEQAERDRIKEIEKGRLSDTAMMDVFLSERLNSIDWPMEVSPAYEIGDDTVVFDVTLPDISDWPIAQESATKRRQDYLTHIHSVSFRIIGETFYILPGVRQVVFSGYVWQPNKTTGQLEETYLLSTKVWRTAWERINFERLDWVDVVGCFDEFETRREYNKTATIKPIEPFEGKDDENK